MKRLLLCLLVLLTARLVAASAGDLPEQFDAQVAILDDTFRVHRKQPFVAFTLSGLGTAGGSVLVWKNTEGNNAFAAGVALLVVGPALGHLYAGGVKGAATGTAIRVVGLGLAVGGGNLIVDGIGCEGRCRGVGFGVPLFISGGLLILGSTLSDVLSAPAAANQFNRRHGLVISPVVGAEPGVYLAVRL